MRKLLSTDLDGTIVFNAAISREDLDAMAGKIRNALRALGHGANVPED